MYVYIYRVLLYIITGAPLIVPSVAISDVPYILSWGEPFNNLDPIVNYTVSCLGDVTCPPNFTTTDNTTRSYTITNLTPMTDYTFSVVATNSIGSGEAGIVNITTPSGEKIRNIKPCISLLQAGTYLVFIKLVCVCLCVCVRTHVYLSCLYACVSTC